MENAVESFRKKLDSSGDIYKAKEFMETTLNMAKFNGQSASEFTSNLRKSLEGIINPKVKIHLVNLYKTATSSGDIVVSHSNIWSKVITDMGLLVGPEPVVRPLKEEVVKEMATIYYSKLALKEENIFKTEIERATPQNFYNRMVDLKRTEVLNGFVDSKIKLCEDFGKTGVSTSMLNDIRNTQKAQYRGDVDRNILKNMYKVKSYFVERYRGTLKHQNVRAENSGIWPNYENEINGLRFESDSEKRHYIHTISKEISEIYYRLFREEVHRIFHHQWTTQDNGAFRHTYNHYKDQNNMNGLISRDFPEYEPFSRQGHFHIWRNEANVLENELKKILNEGYHNRRLDQPPPEKKKNVLQKVEREFRRIFKWG